MKDEYYIGWADRAPTECARFVRRTLVGLLVLILVGAAMLAAFQRNIGVAAFEWGVKKQFGGIFRVWPYPHLLVPRPAVRSEAEAFSSYFLVAPWKFGLSQAAVSKYDGQYVSLHGTLIYRDTQTMIEVDSADIVAQPERKTDLRSPPLISLGQQTLKGEIVDSKCYFGVMNPGQAGTHRACARMCIDGGIPPVFMVAQKNGPAVYLLLVLPDGKPANDQVLDYVGEPLTVTGEVQQQDGLLILRSAPMNFKRL